jgi:hypothetical protein
MARLGIEIQTEALPTTSSSSVGIGSRADLKAVIACSREPA